MKSSNDQNSILNQKSLTAVILLIATAVKKSPQLFTNLMKCQYHYLVVIGLARTLSSSSVNSKCSSKKNLNNQNHAPTNSQGSTLSRLNFYLRRTLSSHKIVSGPLTAVQQVMLAPVTKTTQLVQIVLVVLP